MLSALIPLIVLTLAANARSAEQDEQRGIEFFEKKIRPVLAENCYGCHSSRADEVKAGLKLDSREGMLAGGESGAMFKAGDAKAGLLLEAIRYEGLEMPPERKLPDAVIADFEQWITLGAPIPVDRVTAETSKPTGIDFEAARQFWSFQPPQASPTPTVENTPWIRRPIDGFVLAKLEAAGLAPNEPADRRTLIRRVTFDLTGLPPTPNEVDAFLRDTSPDAYERLVERLLDSPHYGERWARLWLDVARYAEDQAHIVGNNNSLFYPNAYKYRDWVIAALNDDVPYDRFIKLQLAADKLEGDDGPNLAALGFLGLGPKYYRRNSPEVMADEWEDRVDTVTRGLLGFTVACARCHDHKYDPIPTSDYYALAGVFASTEMYNRPLVEEAETEKNGQAKDPQQSLHIVRDAAPRDLKVYLRGDVNNQGELAERRFPQILTPGQTVSLQQDSGRLQLAEAIADRGNPLTARVIVNRVWAQHFGHALVGTPSNFGKLGDAPTHPQLLDDLAARFMDAGWSLKWMHREILLSATYRQNSRIDETKQAADPANRLLGRMNRRRLSVEQWRDAILAVSGRLDHSMGGPSIEPDDPEQTRRTVYARISRLELNRMLSLFDFPDPNSHSARRSETTTPLQKLFVLNSPFMVRQADALLARLEREVENDDASRIERAYALLFGRAPLAEELEVALAYVNASNDGRDARWSQYAQVLLASNEMLMLD
ncbi:MAG: PSD1 and planctomycete cytochrome C domain-containing protein [Pirellulaceae bacterium]